jgi:hypothetical protein
MSIESRVERLERQIDEPNDCATCAAAPRITFYIPGDPEHPSIGPCPECGSEPLHFTIDLGGPSNEPREAA